MANVYMVRMTVRSMQQCTLVVQLTLERTLVVRMMMLAHISSSCAFLFTRRDALL